MSQTLLAAGLLARWTDVPPLYVVLWAGLLALSVLLVVLMRSRWGRSKTVYKCAVLSLLVHVMLACLAMTVRIVVGSGGGQGGGPPIRVRLVEEAPPAPQVAMAAPQEATDEVPSEPLEAPPLFEAEPAKEPEPEAAEVAQEMAAEDPAAPAAEMPDAPHEQDPFEVVEADTPAAPPEAKVAQEEVAEAAEVEVVEATTQADVAPTDGPIAAESVVAAPAVTLAARPAPHPYANRTSGDRLALVESEGGSRETEAAVVAALDWLAAAQSPDGRWDASRFGAGNETRVLGHDRHGAGGNADTGISGLAILAFLGAGHTHLEGDYRAHVRSGLEYLMRSQGADGNLAGEAELFARMYCHAMATFALGEAQAMSGDKRLEPTLRRAVAYSIRAQHPSTGGWRYRVGDTGDTSQLGWQMMSLWSARQAGLEVPDQTWTGIERFLRSVRRGQKGGLASYRPDGPASTSMTAEAFYCRLLLDEAIGGGLDLVALDEATEAVLANRPTADRINLYYWYYATLALHQRQQFDPRAREAWQAWNSDLTGVLLDGQVATGPDAGSWSPNTVWGSYGGRVYSTSMAALCLEVYYRYAPTTHGEWIAAEPKDVVSE